MFSSILKSWGFFILFRIILYESSSINLLNIFFLIVDSTILSLLSLLSWILYPTRRTYGTNFHLLPHLDQLSSSNTRTSLFTHLFQRSRNKTDIYIYIYTYTNYEELSYIQYKRTCKLKEKSGASKTRARVTFTVTSIDIVGRRREAERGGTFESVCIATSRLILGLAVSPFTSPRNECQSHTRHTKPG